MQVCGLPSRRLAEQFDLTQCDSFPDVNLSGQLVPRQEHRLRRHDHVALIFSQALPKPIGGRMYLLRLIDYDERIGGQFEQRGGARVRQNPCELPGGHRVAWPRVLHQREHHRSLHLHHGPLRRHVEPAHRIDRVAEELDPQRLVRPRREDIDDAAAHREFANHFHRIAFGVTDAVQMFRQVVQPKVVVKLQRQRQLLIERAGVGPQQRRGDRGDRDRGKPGSEAVEPDSPLFTDLGVGRQALRRQHIEGGQKLRAWLGFVVDEKLKKRFQRGEQAFCFLSPVGEQQQRFARALPEQSAIQRLGRKGETGERLMGVVP